MVVAGKRKVAERVAERAIRHKERDILVVEVS